MEFLRTKKVVRFLLFVEVVFIPSRGEYSIFKESLWYSKADFLFFRKDANRFVF
jgi:hypothetical protein